MIAIEIISFKEPSEYKPNSSWKEIFIGKTTEDTLVAGKDIATISGATMSARAISNAARVALAIAQEKF
jgi:Na+-translocating ferredoxin:NAD+ oxidoreductase RnfG subunit